MMRSSLYPRGAKQGPGFTLIELIVCIAVISLVMMIASLGLLSAMDRARTAQSAGNLRELAQANLLYAADNGGYFAPASSIDNLTRWHGYRPTFNAPFDPTKGYLSPYLGYSGEVKQCPLLSEYITGSSSWEDGSGGYGYNSAYIGGRPDAADGHSAQTHEVAEPASTLMFATTAFAKGNGLQEYPFAEPYQWVDPNWNLSGALQPSVHFRANGKAIIAWCDASVTLEPPARLGSENYYGGNNAAEQIGWPGPSENNGYWNTR